MDTNYEKSKNMTEKHTVERTYYHELNDGKIFPDEESMLAYLLDEGIIFVGNDYGSGKTTLYININDYFGPGSDAEDFPSKDIPKLFDMYRKEGYDGVAQYVADKRGIPNKSWKEAYRQL